MTFGLINWLKSKYADLNYEVPLWFPSREQPDHREWLLTNGLGGYSSSTVSGAHTRRYHGLLVSAVEPPHLRHVVLSRVDEVVTINGIEYSLATNHWASGVLSPTGYKFLESFALLPSPTWVYDLNGHYLIKQVALKWGSNELTVGYTWLPDSDNSPQDANLNVRLLAGYRGFHDQLGSSSDDRYPQFVSPNHCLIMLAESKRLCLTWNAGEYETQKQWWWDFHWPEETARGLPDRENLCFVGSVNASLQSENQICLGVSLDRPIEKPNCDEAVNDALTRQRQLLRQANLPKTAAVNSLVVACDQFLVAKDTSEASDLGVIEGYPWFGESGRVAMISLPGLTLSTKRFSQGKRIIGHYSGLARNGLIPNRFVEYPKESVGFEYGAIDVTLWWAWALSHYHKATKDDEFVKEQLPMLIEAAGHFIHNTHANVRVDATDGLIVCTNADDELSWMDAKVAEIPITPRAGKAVELCALWYNFLETIIHFARTLAHADDDIASLESIATLARQSMQKFWNADKQCLYDVIDPVHGSSGLPEQSMRPNQLLAVALPYRALSAAQEKSVLIAVEAELITPLGLRSLAASDPAYQGMYGCGFAHADQYHRDLSYHQGSVWPWLLGVYCDALINVFGNNAETTARIAGLIQPLLVHLMDEAGLGTVSEIFDGSKPHLPRGCIADAWAVAEIMRFVSWQNRR